MASISDPSSPRMAKIDPWEPGSAQEPRPHSAPPSALSGSAVPYLILPSYDMLQTGKEDGMEVLGLGVPVPCTMHLCAMSIKPRDWISHFPCWTLMPTPRRGAT